MKGVQCYELFGGIALKNHACCYYLLLSCQESITVTQLLFGSIDRATSNVTTHIRPLQLLMLYK